jgi:hypothetical protein
MSPQVSRPGGGFLIAPELIVEDMEDTLASMPQDLQVKAGLRQAHVLLTKQQIKATVSTLAHLHACFNVILG